jgi:ABC-type nitrate/sulfonate/bicarbonate transport system substrate-binding protein
MTMKTPRALRVLAAVAAASLTLAGCAGEAPTSTDGKLDKVALQFNWITNATWSGSYLADENGHYKAAGLDVDLRTGGPNIDFMAPLSTGEVLMAFAGMTEPMTLNKDGADFRIVGTMYQKSPISIVSLKKANINTPKDLEGRKLGLGATSRSLWDQFATVAGVDKSKVEIVPIQFGVDTLVSGDIDAMMGYVTEAPIALAAKGLEPNYFLLQDYGYGYFVDVYTVRQSDLDDPVKRDLIKRLLKSDLQGQLDMIKNPEQAGKVTVQRFGDELGLDLNTEIATARAAAQLFYSDTTKEKGIGYMGGEELRVAMQTMNSILGTNYPLDGKGFVVNDLLDEIRAEDPSFGQLPPRA